MIYTYAITITAFYSLLLILIFLSKKRIKNEQTTIFSKLLISNFIGLITELVIIIYLLYNSTTYNTLLALIFIKVYLIYTCIFVNQLTLYFFSVTYNKKDNDYYNRIKLYSNITCTIVMTLSFALPIHVIDLYSYGTAQIFVATYTIINFIFWMSCLIRNYNDFTKNVKIPLIIILLISIASAIIQLFAATLSIVTILEFEIVIIIYLTMENTDYKMIKDLEEAKAKVQDAYASKNEFLKNMSHEIRTPLNGIIGLSEDIKEYDNEIPKELLNETNEIIYNSNLLLETVSSIIDINKLNSQEFDNIEDDYNVNQIIEQINKSIADKVKENVKLNIKVSDKIPTLYGDNNHIRQVITKILENSISSTTNGNINLTIDTVTKDDKLNLRIIIEDSGHGIHEDIIPYIYNYNDEKIKNNKHYHAKIILNFTVVKKIVDMLHGTISVSSTYKEGTTVVIEIPQKTRKDSDL